MYQVGLTETDAHIEYFWAALECLSQEELSRFIKFACNQERIPQLCPCREGGHESTHVPPYPMKIAPPDGPGQCQGQDRGKAGENHTDGYMRTGIKNCVQ